MISEIRNVLDIILADQSSSRSSDTSTQTAVSTETNLTETEIEVSPAPPITNLREDVLRNTRCCTQPSDRCVGMRASYKEAKRKQTQKRTTGEFVAKESEVTNAPRYPNYQNKGRDDSADAAKDEGGLRIERPGE